MGMVKKEYTEWCERNDVNPVESEELQLSQTDAEWMKEYEEWSESIERNDHA
jgi:hypothetical protein